MIFELVWLPEAQSQLERIAQAARASIQKRAGGSESKSSRQEGLFKQVLKCIELLAANPRHPGLATHVFHSLKHPRDPKQKVFEVYVQNKTPGAYRVFWCYGPKKNQITIMNITAHP